MTVAVAECSYRLTVAVTECSYRPTVAVTECSYRLTVAVTECSYRLNVGVTPIVKNRTTGIDRDKLLSGTKYKIICNADTGDASFDTR